MRRLVVLAVLLVLATAACKLETNFGAVINADGSGTLIGEIGVDDEAAELFLEGQDPFEGNELTDLPGARTREERRGDLTFYIVEVDVEDIENAEQDLIGNESSMLSDLDIEVTDTVVRVTGSATAEDSLGGDTDGFDPELIEDSLSATVYFTMPGSITTHNADRQEGNTLFWEVPILGGTLDIQAESDPTGTPAGGSDGFPVWAYAIIAVVVLGAVWYFMQSRSGGDSEAPPPPPPTDE